MTSSASEPPLVLRAALSVLLCLAAAGAHAQAPAEDANRAAARQLATEGFAALERNQPAEAEAHFTRAIVLYPAPTLYLARGRARLQLFWLVAAGEDFRAAIRMQATPQEPASFAAARADAAKELAALEPRVPTLTVQLSGGQARELRVNGSAWPLETAGIARPLDPGKYVVEAIDAQGRIHTAAVRLEERQPAVVTLELPASPAPSPASAAAAAPAQGTPDAATPQASDTRASSSAGPSTAVWISAGVTLAFVVGAVVTGVLALDRKADFDHYNGTDLKRSTKQELRDSASAMAWVNTALVGAAVVGGGVTAYLWFTQPDTEPRAEQSARREPGLGGTVRVAF